MTVFVFTYKQGHEFFWGCHEPNIWSPGHRSVFLGALLRSKCPLSMQGWFLAGVVCHEHKQDGHKITAKIKLTLSSPVMPFGVILLILFFICYNFGGPKNCSIWRTECIMSHGITGLERVKKMQDNSILENFHTNANQLRLQQWFT
jgi:hypothetical protein